LLFKLLKFVAFVKVGEVGFWMLDAGYWIKKWSVGVMEY
jgi:hypothetical protein